MKSAAVVCLIAVFQMLAGCVKAQSAPKPELIVQTGHSKAVSGIALSADGKLLASAGDDGTFKLWDTVRARELRSFSAPLDSYNTVAFNPNGKLLAVSSINNGCKIINVETGITLDQYKSENLTGRAAAFSPDGKTLACAGSSGNQPPNGDVELWDIATGKISRIAKSDQVTDIAFSPNGQTIVTGSRDHTVKLWDVKTGAERQAFTGHSDTVETVAFSPDGLTIAAGDWDGKIKLWNAQTGSERHAFDVKKACGSLEIKSTAFSPNGKFIAASCSNLLFLWDTATGEKKYQVKDEEIITDLVFTSDGASLLSGGFDTIKTRNAATGKEFQRFKRNANSVGTLAFTADGKRLASASQIIGDANNYIRLWSADTGSEMRPFDVKDTAAAVAFSPNGEIMAGAGESVLLWDAASGRQLRQINYKADFDYDYLASLIFSPDGKIIAGGSKKTVRLWDAANGSELKVLRGHSDSVDMLAFSPNGKVLATGDGSDDFIKLWDAATGSELMTLKGTLEGYESGIQAFAFSPDGQYITISSLGEIAVINLKTGKKVRAVPTLGDGNYQSLAFSPDGKILAGGDTYDGHITFWDFQTGKELQKLTGHKSGINSIAFGADGKVLASSSEDSTIKLWNTATGTEMASLIAVGETDWLVVTPDGLFDGSPNAWKELFWRFNSNTFNTVPVEAFFKEFYYPGLLGEVLQGVPPRSPERNLAQIDVRAPGVNIVAVNRQDVRGGTKTMIVSQPTVKVSIGVAENPNAPRNPKFAPTGGARDLRLFRNGSLVKIWNKSVFDLTEKDGCRQLSPTKEIPVRRALCEAEVQTIAGDNNFSAYVFNGDNVKSRDSEITIKGADSLQRKGTLYVLAIGVNEYASPNFNLRYAVADVESIAEVLKAQQTALNNYTATEVVELTNKNATKANILAAFSLFGHDEVSLPENSPADLRKIKKLKPEDALVIYYAGHGTASKDRFYLIPHDGFPTGGAGENYYAELYARSISDENLESLLETVDAGKILMVIDACNSGQALEAAEKRRGPMNSKGLAQLAYEKGIYILTAAQSFQSALEVSQTADGKAIEHGLLTYSLLEGLKAARADANADKQISEREWLNFAVAEVPQMQIETMRRRGAKISENPARRSTAVSISGGKSQLSTQDRGLQTPRVFYRRDDDVKPFVIAAP